MAKFSCFLHTLKFSFSRVTAKFCESHFNDESTNQLSVQKAMAFVCHRPALMDGAHLLQPVYKSESSLHDVCYISPHNQTETAHRFPTTMGIRTGLGPTNFHH